MSKSRSQSISDADEKKIEQQEELKRKTAFFEDILNYERSLGASNEIISLGDSSIEEVDENDIPVKQEVANNIVVPAEKAAAAEREEEAKQTFIQRHPVAGTIAVVTALALCGALLGFAIASGYGIVAVPAPVEIACFIIAASGLFSLIKPVINTINYWVKELFSTPEEKEIENEVHNERPSPSRKNTLEVSRSSVSQENVSSQKKQITFPEDNGRRMTLFPPENGNSLLSATDIMAYYIANINNAALIEQTKAELSLSQENAEDKKEFDAFVQAAKKRDPSLVYTPLFQKYHKEMRHIISSLNESVRHTRHTR
jgi:hypothetical protein